MTHCGMDLTATIVLTANPILPWFYQELNESTTSDIEARTLYGGTGVSLKDLL